MDYTFTSKVHADFDSNINWRGSSEFYISSLQSEDLKGLGSHCGDLVTPSSKKPNQRVQKRNILTRLGIAKKAFLETVSPVFDLSDKIRCGGELAMMLNREPVQMKTAKKLQKLSGFANLISVTSGALGMAIYREGASVVNSMYRGSGAHEDGRTRSGLGASRS